MIGASALASRAAVVLLVTALLGNDGGDPAVALAADDLVIARSHTALVALDQLASNLAGALAHARSGASNALRGEASAGRDLVAAAEATELAADAATGASEALAALDGARRASDPAAPGVSPGVDSAQIAAIAPELRSAASAADEFGRMQSRARDLLQHVEGALTELRGGRVSAAGTSAAAARSDHDALLEWRVQSRALPVWLGTTDAMISAVTALIEATRVNDQQAADDARADLAALTPEAATADRALRLAITEGADAVTRPAVERLAAAMASVDDLRDVVAATAAGGNGG